MKQMVTHLHVKSSFSFLRGLASPQALAKRAAEAGMDALALTDHHCLTGAVEFYMSCLAVGVRPILGLEIQAGLPPGVESFKSEVLRLCLLAEDRMGWRSLSRISSALNGDEAVLPFERLAEENRGLICMTGGVRSVLSKMAASGDMPPSSAAWQAGWLGSLAEVFPGRLYVEVQRHSEHDHPLAIMQAALAHAHGLPAVAAQDIHYLTPDLAGLQRVVAAIRSNQPMDKLPAEACAPPGAHFRTPLEMEQLYDDLPGALAATREIAERCRLELPLGKPLFPEIELPAGMSADEVLRQKAEAGALHLYAAPQGGLSHEVRSRLEHELEVIAGCGYAVLFLIVQDILEYARQAGVPYSSRGSAASSLVAHCLGITSPDPLRLNLYFERFLNPARSTPPDIDTDLCSRRREDVIRYVYERFGLERVATVCTINCFRSRSALREVAKAYGLPPEEVSKLADALPYHWYGGRGGGTDEPPYSELAERYPSSRYQQIFRDAAALIGLPHHLSVHPGGMVISPGAMTDLVPTQMASKGVLISQFDLESIEHLGLVKIDLLGIRGLTVLGDVAESAASGGTDAAGEQKSVRTHPVASRRGLDWLDEIPLEDEETSQTLQHGRTIGCFQIESPGMRATLREVRARNIDDLMVALALYRPGPLTGGLKDEFVRRHRAFKDEEISRSEHGAAAARPYEIHPALTPLLADTFGVILYQEQVLRIAHELAGLSLADADLLRRAMSHFDPGKQMETLKHKFVAGVHAHSGVPPETAGRVWELMAAFAGYGFPKAHAASYAQIGWRSAWCKTHYPAVFMASVLANWGGYYSQRVYLTEARRLGLALRPPQINYAQREFSVCILENQPVLFMGLDQVRDLTRRTQETILRERPFFSLIDFLGRVDPRPVEAENLAKAGALENFGTIPVLLRFLQKSDWRGGQMLLFGMETSGEEDWTLVQKVSAQEEILGTSVIAHPLELAAEKLRRAQAITTIEAAARLGQKVRVAGMRQTWRRTATTRGDMIYFMALEDLEGMLDVVIFSDVYRRSRDAFATPGPYIVEGTVELDGERGEPFIRAEKILAVN